MLATQFLGIAVAACTLILNLAFHSRERSSEKEDATNRRRDHHAPPIFPEAQTQHEKRKQQKEEKSAVGTQKWLGLQEKFLMEPRIELIQTRSQSDIADNSAAGPRQGKPRGGPGAATAAAGGVPPPLEEEGGGGERESLAALEARGALSATWVLWGVVEVEAGAGAEAAQRRRRPEDHFEFHFCRLALADYSRDPAACCPFFEDLQRRSRCGEPGNARRMGWAAAEAYLKSAKRVIPPTAFIHTEARCGSTLVMNVLASNPQVLAFSEPIQIMLGLGACIKNKCDLDFFLRFLRLVIGLMGISDTHEWLFLKLGPPSVLHVQFFQLAYPNTPNIWMHRDPVQVMMSQLQGQRNTDINRYNQWFFDQLGKDGTMALSTSIQSLNKTGNRPPCLRPLPQAASALGLRTPRDYAGREEYCAVYLQKVCEAAVARLGADPLGLPLAYRDEGLAEYVLDLVLPGFLGVHFDPAARAKAAAVATQYSKGVGRRGGERPYKGDAQEKQSDAWPDLVDNAEKYVREVYNKLVDIEGEKIEQVKNKTLGHHRTTIFW